MTSVSVSERERARLNGLIASSGITTLDASGELAHLGLRVVVAATYDEGQCVGERGICIDNDPTQPDVQLDNEDSKRIITKRNLYSETDWNRLIETPTARYIPGATQFTLTREQVEDLIREAHDSAPAVADRLRKVLDPRTERTFSVTIKSIDPQGTLDSMQKAVEGLAEISVVDEGESEDIF